MKVAVYPECGRTYIPGYIREQLEGYEGIHARIKVAEVVENMPLTHEEITAQIYELFRSDYNKNRFYIKSLREIFVKDLGSEYGLVYKIKIADVDTSKLWKIADYDGAERIEYYKEPVIIDKELNYGKW